VTHEVHEAVALADRVLVIEDGGLALDLAVDLPRPRDRESIDFVRRAATVLRRIMTARAADSQPGDQTPSPVAVTELLPGVEGRTALDIG